MKDIDHAWELHDLNPDEFGCQKEKGFNQVLGHSHFNEVCKKKVFCFARDNPMVRALKELPPVKPPKLKCQKCGKMYNADDMYKFEEDIPSYGQRMKTITIFLCKRKCGERRKKLLLRKGELVVPNPPVQLSESEGVPHQPESQSHNESGPGAEETASHQKTADMSCPNP